ncbi:MAG: aryl-sulfate sulfotransferase, partial [Sutterella wadsworthensis]|nr:aryl-sulfate sulfotransferase [Sutterella wadsworthensis]
MLLTKRQFLTSVLALSVSAAARAAGGPSGPAVHFQSQGKIGEVFVNPYKIAPLTAVIGNGGYELRNASVRIVPKPNGQEIAYSVADRLCRTHGGIPVFGLYPDYQNTVEVEYDRVANDAARTVEHIRESYKIYAGPAYIGSDGTDQQTGGWFRAEVLKCAPKYKDRLYLVNNILENNPRGGRAVWNNPAGGALQWGGSPEVGIIDSTGALRWYLMPDSIFEPNSIEWGGVMMGFRQNNDGAFTWGYGQRYVKYDLMGREIFNRQLPDGYADFSHALEPMENGHYLIRVSDANYRRADGRNVRTVRDVIIEVNEAGEVLDDWNLNNILDPYRSTVIKTLDQGAVCLNIDVDKAGKTMTAEELAKLDASDDFGDILGTGP